MITLRRICSPCRWRVRDSRRPVTPLGLRRPSHCDSIWQHCLGDAVPCSRQERAGRSRSGPFLLAATSDEALGTTPPLQPPGPPPRPPPPLKTRSPKFPPPVF